MLAVCAVALCNAIVLSASTARTFTSPSAVPARPYALVFGAGLNPDQTPSAMLADRLDAGIALLRMGKVRTLLFSGDNGTVEHNELRAMLNYALARRVPRSKIVLDYAGFTTQESCFRAPRVFDVHAAVLVTQAFHLPRALYLCRREGMDVVGLATPDWGKYDAGLLLREAVAREMLARVKAVVRR
ncbi:MAG TPA: ElyC/SanA/YdcF family protein [Candidatus Baltobacteraceae bacterium]|nr:ElyC/SanA/YdcF family protein [Candidatus Baltobacteraceae bacterium]